MPDDYLDGLQAQDHTTRWREHLIAPSSDGHLLVVVDDHRMVGFASFGPARDSDPDCDIGQLYAINLDPDLWGRGLGRALLNVATDRLRERGRQARFRKGIPHRDAHSPPPPAACRRKLYSAPIGALSERLDATFFALSDPKRRGILERLGRGPATLSQLAVPSGLTLNGIKKHVGILKLLGLVETEKVGRARECRLGPAMTLGEAGEWIEAHRSAWEGRLDRFERFVERAG